MHAAGSPEEIKELALLAQFNTGTRQKHLT